MIRRCHDPKSINYKDYGGAGIYVCDEWLGDHTAFENWMLDNGYQDTWEIDRIDHTKGYCPENCRLVPPGYNSKFNKSNCVKLYNRWRTSYRSRYCQKTWFEK